MTDLRQQAMKAVEKSAGKKSFDVVAAFEDSARKRNQAEKFVFTDEISEKLMGNSVQIL